MSNIEFKTIKKKHKETWRQARDNMIESKGKGRNFFSIKKIFFVLLLAVIGYIGYFGYSVYDTVNAIPFAPKELAPLVFDQVTGNESDAQLQKDSSGNFTNVLIVGKDTRKFNSGLQNTDSIMVGSYNHSTTDVNLFSIPRDFWVRDFEYGRAGKINSMYALAENYEKDSGLPYLQSVTSDITGLEIQYYVMVDLEAFTEIVDSIDGVEIDVESGFTDYNFPNDNNSGVKTVKFEEGLQTMDGDTALTYARSRQSQNINQVTGNPHGSDYDRARRQQFVMQAILDKIMSTQTLLNLSKVNSLLEAFADNVEFTEPTSDDLQAGLNILKNEEIGERNTFVLDPFLGGLNKFIIENGLDTGVSSIGPTAGINRYAKLNQLISNINDSPTIFAENATIKVYDIGAGWANTQEYVEQLQLKYPNLDITYPGTLGQFDLPKNYAYRSASSNKDVLNTYELILEEVPQPLSPFKPDEISEKLNGEDIVILMSEIPTDDSTVIINSDVN